MRGGPTPSQEKDAGGDENMGGKIIIYGKSG
jgi:hypothetical protein